VHKSSRIQGPLAARCTGASAAACEASAAQAGLVRSRWSARALPPGEQGREGHAMVVRGRCDPGSPDGHLGFEPHL